ncbi:MAG: ATP-binding protein [Treponema sp.]|nr:ATP-binding protein [Treponema sp.]
MSFIGRHAERTIRRFSEEFPAVLVTGARQTGKTTLLKKITAGRSIGSTTFDDPMEELSAKSDPRAFMEFHPAPYLFDEIQYVPDLFRYLKMAVDSNRSPGMYFLTGSQQFRLMESATESLSGRIGIIQLHPLSAREIRGDAFSEPFVPSKEFILGGRDRLKTADFSVTGTWKAIYTGGYPEVVKGTVSAGDFYANYLKTYIERDIRKLVHVSDEMQFLQFVSVVAARTGQLVNYGDIGNEVGISDVTVKKWLSLLVSSGLVHLLRPFSANVEKRVVKTPKLYFMDTGLAAYLTHWTSPGTMQGGAMAGAFFETYAVSEIIKSFCSNGVEPPLYFYRDKDKTEIDLMVYRDDVLYPVEIKKTATPSSDDARNFFITGRLRNMRIGNSIIICNCAEPATVRPGVTAIPIGYV